jgi:lysophospholipase L1-like esterase
MAVEIAGTSSAPGSPWEEATALRAWRAAAAGRAAAPCNVLILGDSNSVGYYASTRANTWVRRFSAALMAANSQTQDEGYVPRHSLTNYLNTWTSSGTVTEFSTSGLGYAATSLQANGGYIEIAKTCDRFWIVYTGGNLIGKFGVQIDGGGSVNVPSLAPATVAGGFVWDSGSLSNASHTVRITSTDTLFPCRIEGVYFFNGNGNTSGSQGTLSAADSLTGSGFRVWNGAKFGTRAGTFAVTSATTWWTDGLSRVNPDLVILLWGTNEITAGTTTAQMMADYTTVVTRINTVMVAAGRPTPSYLIEVPHGTGADATTFAPYRAALKAVATTLGVATFDRYGLYGYVGTSTADEWGLTATLDGASRVHLSDKGHRLAGETTARYLLTSAGIGAS